jgi:hypothetical protein
VTQLACHGRHGDGIVWVDVLVDRDPVLRPMLGKVSLDQHRPTYKIFRIIDKSDAWWIARCLVEAPNRNAWDRQQMYS